MRENVLYAGVLVLMLVMTGEIVIIPAQEVTKDEETRWWRWVIPMPKEAVIEGKVIVPASGVALTLREEATELERCAAGELAALFLEKTGKEMTIDIAENKKAAFEVLIGVCGTDGRLAGRQVPGTERLANLPCPEQGYMIMPLDGRTLALVSTDPKGVYYAAKTLKQLLMPAFAKDASTVEIPLARVTDWPDLIERGLWGGSANADIEWLAERKMNLVESHVSLSVNEEGRGVAKIPGGLLARAQRNAVNLVPIITHLEQLPGEVFKRFPEVRGMGNPEAWRKVGSVMPACFSHPKMQQIMSDWMCSLAQYPEVTDVNVWLSENAVQCECDKCKAINQFVLESQVAVRAWEAAKRIRPNIRLRLLLTQGSYKSNDKVLATVPKEVGITYYHGGLTYNSSREPMIYPLLEEYAAKGGWLGCYPQLTASWRIVCPWSGPQFIKARMTEFVSKKLKCLCGYATPSNRFYEFNVTAAAEWSWNVNGRSEREFALAWATREGLADPEKAADWAVMLGPVGWDVYGSGVPFLWTFGKVDWLFTPNKMPELGKKYFTYFPTREHFDEDLAVCDRAMALAQELKAPALIEETRVIRGLVQMLKGMYLLACATAPANKMTDEDRNQAETALALVDEGSCAAHDGLLAWGIAVAPELAPGTKKAPSRLNDTIKCVEDVMSQVSDIAINRGIKDPNRPYRTHTIGKWVTEDFKTGAAQTKTWEVTSYVSGAGVYKVYFYYDSGWYGAQIKRVALVSTPPDNPNKQTEVACDKHDGITGYSPRDTIYTLHLKEYDPKQKYFIVADLVGIPPDSPPDKQGCTGHVVMKKTKE